MARTTAKTAPLAVAPAPRRASATAKKTARSAQTPAIVGQNAATTNENENERTCWIKNLLIVNLFAVTCNSIVLFTRMQFYSYARDVRESVQSRTPEYFAVSSNQNFSPLAFES